ARIRDLAQKGKLAPQELAIKQGMLEVQRQNAAAGLMNAFTNQDRTQWGAFNQNLDINLDHMDNMSKAETERQAKAVEVNSKGEQKYPGFAKSMGIEMPVDEAAQP